MTARAVVFAYHNVGVRCLQVLRAAGVDITLVVTHEDDPNETCWYDSVADLAISHAWPVLKPVDANSLELLQAVQDASPDFIFSFYYRHMLSTELLGLARLGAFNMHGSLLPLYRGRAPVNWAILHGETQTGATLHEMTARADAGAIIGHMAVPILPDDTAIQVMQKVTFAAEITLWKVMPDLLSNQAVRLPNRISEGSYFGRRTPEDGRIDWNVPAQTVYNLVRALAPPYPGAFTEIGVHRFIIGAARLESCGHGDKQPIDDATLDTVTQLGLHVRDGKFVGYCAFGGVILIHTLLYEGQTITPSRFEELVHANAP
ncbi:MAG: formyl transferase domain protein [Linnemannia gamsii]|nr:MAG: formyl transferase domain protein [Linnemannia gamsii]